MRVLPIAASVVSFFSFLLMGPVLLQCHRPRRGNSF
jgi:hypothetical protein